MIVYIAIYAYWDDFEIRRVFSTRERARQYLIDCGADPDSPTDQLQIEEYEVDSV